MRFVLVHQATPPSFNQVGHSGSRWTWTRTKKEWQEIIEVMLLASRVPRGLDRVAMQAELVFTDRRRRDAVNYRTLLEKCAGDALVNGGWLADDTPDHFAFETVIFEVGERPLTKLILEIELSS